MRNKGLLLLVGTALSFAGILSGCSTLGTQPQVKANVVMKTEDTVRLVDEGKAKASRQFCIGETVPVYRYYGRFEQSREVGKVKIVRILDDKYLEAVVAGGKIKDGDVAKKNSASCLIQLPEHKG